MSCFMNSSGSGTIIHTTV